MNRIRRRTVSFAMAVATFATVAGLASPAQASVPPPYPGGAHIQRTILLESTAAPGSVAWIIPTGSRSIVLAKGRYRWSNEFYDAPWGNFDVARDIDLAAGEYWWNCRVHHKDSYWYATYCYLYRVANGGYAYLPLSKQTLFHIDGRFNMTWRSQLRPV